MAIDKATPKADQMTDASVLWRASLWGGAAIVALAMVILMTLTDAGSQQLQMIFAGEPAAKPITQADFVPRPEADALKQETARLEVEVLELAADRERLYAKIASLERNLSDMTSSIKRELAVVAATTQTPVASTPPPVVSAPATAPPAPAPPPTRLEPVAKAEPKIEPKFEAKIEPRVEPRVEAKVEPKVEPRREPSPIMLPEREAAADPQPQTAPPLGEPIKLPPMRIASNSGDPTGKDIGVDLGGARTLEIMQARWIAVKANFGPLLQGLYPVVARETRAGMIPYRLIVGPLPNAAAASQICARFTASKVTCRSTKFAGEQLTVQ